MATIDRTDVCATCGSDLEGGRTVQVYAAMVYAFCSDRCFAPALAAQKKQRWAARRRAAKLIAIGAVIVGALLTPHPRPSQITASLAPVQRAAAAGPPALPDGWFGPEWPPSDNSLLAALGRDAWIHPLAGPFRRMPRSDSRVFGAGRPGNRAVECRNGHCGVDLGGEIWGEHIRAAHDGIVEYVQRGPNPQHGGRFVRIAHRNGTVITQYFHLAAIPRGLERGVRVKGGDVVGLLGDSGVQSSAPHLHFSISIRQHPGGPEKYMDPEPLIALWPLRVPVDGGESGLVTTLARPGVVIGSMPLMRGRGKKGVTLKSSARSSGRSEAPAETGGATEDEPTAAAAAPDPVGEE
jgi:murein DD-endopeptidase MepM/ murein hydrolase activator NlpD